MLRMEKILPLIIGELIAGLFLLQVEGVTEVLRTSCAQHVSQDAPARGCVPTRQAVDPIIGLARADGDSVTAARATCDALKQQRGGVRYAKRSGPPIPSAFTAINCGCAAASASDCVSVQKAASIFEKSGTAL